MSSHTKRVGEIGECAIIHELMKIDGIGVSKPIGDNLPYDLIVDINSKLYRCQVKTCEFIKDDKMIFSVSITNPFTRTNKKYTEDDTDLFLLHCIENNYCGLLTFDDYTSKEITIREKESLGNFYYKNVKVSEEFDMKKRIEYYKIHNEFNVPLLYSFEDKSLFYRGCIKPPDKDVIDNRWKIIQESDIDYTKFGWANKLSKLFGITPQVTARYVKEHYPEFYANCYKK